LNFKNSSFKKRYEGWYIDREHFLRPFSESSMFKVFSFELDEYCRELPIKYKSNLLKKCSIVLNA